MAAAASAAIPDMAAGCCCCCCWAELVVVVTKVEAEGEQAAVVMLVVVVVVEAARIVPAATVVAIPGCWILMTLAGRAPRGLATICLLGLAGEPIIFWLELCTRMGVGLGVKIGVEVRLGLWLSAAATGRAGVVIEGNTALVALLVGEA
jgi:hypothetical protein